MASNSDGTKVQQSIEMATRNELATNDQSDTNSTGTTNEPTNRETVFDESRLTATKQKQVKDLAWTNVHKTMEQVEYTGRILDDGIDKLYVFDAMTATIDPARNTLADTELPDTPAAKYYRQVLGQIRSYKPKPSLLELAAQVYKQPDASVQLLTGPTGDVVSSPGNVASTSGNVAPTNRVASS